MRCFKRFCVAFFILSLFNIVVKAQFKEKTELFVEFTQILDNREYFNSFIRPQTILGASSNLIFKAEVDQGHSLNAGFYYLYEYGHRMDAHRPKLNLFYEYQSSGYEFYFGSFPRKNVLEYPKALITDTLNYYRPNVEGGLAKIKWAFGEETIWCDWTSRQTDTVKETFLAGFSGKMKFGMFYFDHYAYMYHSAGAAIRDPNDPIRDNGGGAAYAGIDLSEVTELDELQFDLGMLVSYDRFRPNPYGFTRGAMFRAKAYYKTLGIDASYYRGDKVELYYGDKFYRSGNYARIDLMWFLYKGEKVQAKINLAFHITEEGLDSSQQFFIHVLYSPFSKKQVKTENY